MGNNLNFFEMAKWKTTKSLVKSEDDLNLKDKDNLKFDKMEDNLSFLQNGRF